MKKYWDEVIETFQGLAYMVKHFDPDGIELLLTNSSEGGCRRHRSALINILRNIDPDGRCNMKNKISRILKQWFYEYDKPQKKWHRLSFTQGSGKKKEGVSIYIFTDGVWQSGPEPLCEVEEAIKDIVNKLAARGLDADHVGIQFIRFGNDPKGRERLDRLDSRLQEFGIEKDIVDTEPSNGNVWKMLLGAIDPYWDRLSEDASSDNAPLELKKDSWTSVPTASVDVPSFL